MSNLLLKVFSKEAATTVLRRASLVFIFVTEDMLPNVENADFLKLKGLYLNWGPL